MDAATLVLAMKLKHLSDRFLVERIPRLHRHFQYWRWPEGYRGWLAIALIGLLLAGVVVLVYATGGTKLVYAHAAYIPVIIGGFLFGVPGGVLTAVVAGIGLGPWMPLDVATNTPQSMANWLYRAGFLTAIGALAGALFASLGQQLDAVRRQAYRDSLTDLPNRLSLMEAIPKALSHGWIGQLLILRLRQYKEVLFWLGQDHADELQCATATRLRESLQPEQRLYNLGEGLFGITLDGDDSGPTQQLAAQLIDQLEEPIWLDDIPVLVEGEVGIVGTEQQTTDGLSMLRRATAALAQAEAQGRPVAIYDPAQHRRRRELIDLLPALRDALKRDDQLQLHHQPKVCLRTGRCSSVEALARWDHPERGPIAPARFIPLAENTQLINPFTDWAIAQALRDLQTWRHDDLVMAVNVSVRNLEDETFPERVAMLLDQYGVDGRRLELEITESALISELSEVLRGLQRLRRLGVRVALDDFGTGLSSLTYLKNLPVDVLKLDRSFLAGLATDARNDRIVAGTLAIAHDLGFEVVAEGIEDATSYDWLKHRGCDLGQGYYIGRPMPADELLRWMAKHSSEVRARPS